MITRVVTNKNAPLLNALGLPYGNIDVLFTLVNAKGIVTDAYDYETHERVGGTVKTRTDDTGCFSIELWPTSRGDVPIYYKVHVNTPGFVDFISSLQDDVDKTGLPVDFAEFTHFGRPPHPSEDLLLQKTIDYIKGIAGKNYDKYTVGPAGVKAYQVVMLLVDGTIAPADGTNVTHAGKVMGITLEDGLAGELVDVIRGGVVLNPGWTLSPSEQYFVGAGGDITNIAPTTGFSQVLGLAETPIALYLAVEAPIIL